MAVNNIKIHLIPGHYFLTDQYKWHKENNKFSVVNGFYSKFKMITIVILSAILLWILVPDRLDKSTYVAFNEILFTYFCFMCLLQASYFSQRYHVETYNGLEEIDSTLAKLNVYFVNQSSITMNHITIIFAYIFLSISGFVNMYCSNFCDARPSTVFKFVLMAELIYKNSLFAAVIRIMRDRLKGLNQVLETVGKGYKSCLLCQQKVTSKEEILRIFASYPLEQYCVMHLLK